MYVIVTYARWFRDEEGAPDVAANPEFRPGFWISESAPRSGAYREGPYWHEDRIVFDGSAVDCGVFGMTVGAFGASALVQPLLDIVEASPDIRDVGGWSPRWGRTRSYQGRTAITWADRTWDIVGRRSDFSGDAQFRASQGYVLFTSDRGEQFAI